jgi:hypothetical protein
MTRKEQLLPIPRTQELRIGGHESAGLFSWQTASFEVQRLQNLPLAEQEGFLTPVGAGVFLLGRKYAVPQES